jgi:hypothetical protein
MALGRLAIVGCCMGCLWAAGCAGEVRHERTANVSLPSAHLEREAAETERAGTGQVKGGVAASSAESRGEANQPSSAGRLRPIPPIRTRRNVAMANARTAVAGAELPAAIGKESPSELISGLLLDDFETYKEWAAIGWPNANECVVNRVEADEGGRVLSLLCREGRHGKAGVLIAAPPEADWSRFQAVQLDVKVTGEKPLEISVAFLTSAYFESVRQQVAPGWNRGVVFDLRPPEFKTAPDWEHKSALRGMNAPRYMFVVVYYQGSCQVFLDNVRLLENVPAGEKENARDDAGEGEE